MSKGCDALKSISPEMLPSAWYSISTKLKEIVKNATFKLSGQSAHDLYEYLYSSDLMLWARSVMSEFDEQGTCYLIAWIGALRTRQIYWEVVDSCREVMQASLAFAPPSVLQSRTSAIA